MNIMVHKKHVRNKGKRRVSRLKSPSVETLERDMSNNEDLNEGGKCVDKLASSVWISKIKNWLNRKKKRMRNICNSLREMYRELRLEYPKTERWACRVSVWLGLILFICSLLAHWRGMIIDNCPFLLNAVDGYVSYWYIFGLAFIGGVVMVVIAHVVFFAWEYIVHYVYLPLLYLCIVLMISASVFCGFFLFEWEWLKTQVLMVLQSPILVCLSVIASISILCGLLVLRHRAIIAILWPALLSPVLAFWAFAYAVGFYWKALLGVAWSLGIIAFLIFPLLRWNVGPRHQGKPDTLGRRMLYRRIGSRLRVLIEAHNKQGSGITVAVCGPWGSGKSHFINYLAYTLWDRCKDPDMKSIDCYKGRFTVCSVDLWRCPDKESMWGDIASTLASAISGYAVGLNNRLSSRLLNALHAFRFPGDSLIKSILQLVSTGSDGAGISEKVLNSRIAFPRRAYVLVLDNLDRCDPQIVNALFPVMERLKRIRGLITICALAREELEKRVTNYHNSLNDYGDTLIKVFDLMVTLPSIPIRHARAFMLRMADAQAMQCPNLKEWIMRQQLEFDTPRQMENVVNQLSMLDNCYLLRLRPEGGKVQRYSEYQQRFDAVFYVAALRGIFPGVVAVLEKSERPMVLIQLARTSFATVVGNEYQLKNGEFPEAWGIAAGENVDSRLLRSLLVSLADCSEKDLKEALQQSYLRLTALSASECRQVIDCALNSYRKPSAALNFSYSKEYTEEEEPALYRSVLEYALNDESSLENKLRQNYIKSCLRYDILPDKGRYREYLTSAELLFRLAEARTREIEEFSWGEKKLSTGWQKHISMLLKEMPTSVLGETMRAFNFQLYDESDLSSHQEYAPTFFKIYNAMLRDNGEVNLILWEKEHHKGFMAIPWLIAYFFSKKYFDNLLRGKYSARCRKMLAEIKERSMFVPLMQGMKNAAKSFMREEELQNSDIIEGRLLRGLGSRLALYEYDISELKSYLTPTYVDLWLELRKTLRPHALTSRRSFMMKKLLIHKLTDLKVEVDAQLQLMKEQRVSNDEVIEWRKFRVSLWKILRDVKS